MLFKFSFLILVLASLAHSMVQPSVIATVNGFEITEDEARRILDKEGPISKEDVEKAVLFQLAVEKALKEKTELEPKTATAIRKVIYKAYLRGLTSKNKSRLTVTREDLEDFYKSRPLLRLFQIVLKGAPQQNADRIRAIQSEYKKGTPFRKLVLKYSEDQTALQGGDLDYRSVHNFPEHLFEAAKNTPKNELSKPVFESENTLLFLWTEKKSYPDIPETFRAYLITKLSEKRELAVLRESLGKLRENAEIKYPEGGQN